MPMGICPECGSEIHVSSDVEVGDYVTCPECDAELNVIELDPLEFEVAEFEEGYEEDEDEEW